MNSFSKEISYVEKYEINSWVRILEANQDWIVYRSYPSNHTFEGQPKVLPRVDLILLGVKYIELKTDFYNGFSISKPKNEKSLEIAKKFDNFSNEKEDELRVYEIKSKEGNFYVLTANLWIHVHKEKTGELPLKHLITPDLETYNNYLDIFIKDWIKIK